MSAEEAASPIIKFIEHNDNLPNVVFYNKFNYFEDPDLNSLLEYFKKDEIGEKDIL